MKIIPKKYKITECLAYNRYGNEIKLERLNLETIKMSCLSPYMRFGGDINNLQYVDPEGGPFISIGDDLNEYFNDQTKLIINKIESKPDGIYFKVTIA